MDELRLLFSPRRSIAPTCKNRERIMAFAANNQRFKDAVNEFAHKQLAKQMAVGETVDDMVADHCQQPDKATVRQVWNRCLTPSDFDEIETNMTEVESVDQCIYDYAVNRYFDQDFEKQMKLEIQQLVNDQ